MYRRKLTGLLSGFVYSNILFPTCPVLLCPVYQNVSKTTKSLLSKIVRSLMEEVSKRRMATVALSVISSGQFGFPSDVSADLIVDACVHFLRSKFDQGFSYCHTK